MDLGSITADPGSLLFQISATILFGLVFLFLWRQSKIIYFGLWSFAWVVQGISLLFGARYFQERSLPWLVLYALAEFSFAVLLFAAGRVGFSGPIREWRSSWRILLGFPIFLGIVYAFGWHARLESLHALHAVVLFSVYVYNYTGVRIVGVGGRIFRFSLLSLAAVFLYHAAVLIYLARGAGPLAGGWIRLLELNRFYDFALHSVLAFAALAMWIENQQQRIDELRLEIDRVRQEGVLNLDLDDLTGLLNHAALDRRLREMESFAGVIAVCDLDNFKEVNDRYGHLAGDEILRGVGRLFRASIRKEDEAFRWGGDEFVLFFQNQNRELIDRRLEELGARLRTFQVRGYGLLPITFSWGTVEATGRPLREALESADREMYMRKASAGGRARTTTFGPVS